MIIIFGDAMIDVELHVKRRGVSQVDKNVPVYTTVEEKLLPGGALHVVSLLEKQIEQMKPWKLGLCCFPVYPYVVDPKAKFFCNPEVFNASKQGKMPTEKIRVYDADTGQFLFRLDKEDSRGMTKKERESFERFLAFTKIAAKKSDNNVVVVSDYNKGFISNYSLAKIYQFAREINAKIIADPKKDMFFYVGADVITPNAEEFTLLNGDKFQSTHSSCFVAKKKGQEGCDIFHAGRLVKSSKVEANQSKVKNLCGAGDSFVVGLASALSQGYDEIAAIEFATAYATSFVLDKRQPWDILYKNKGDLKWKRSL